MNVGAAGVQWAEVWMTCNELSLAVQRNLTVLVCFEVER